MFTDRHIQATVILAGLCLMNSISKVTVLSCTTFGKWSSQFCTHYICRLLPASSTSTCLFTWWKDISLFLVPHKNNASRGNNRQTWELTHILTWSDISRMQGVGVVWTCRCHQTRRQLTWVGLKESSADFLLSFSLLSFSSCQGLHCTHWY